MIVDASFHERADWARVRAVYRQCLDCLSGTDGYLPPKLPAFLAELLARISASYSLDEEQYLADAIRNLQLADPDSLTVAEMYEDRRFLSNPIYSRAGLGDRRRPSPFEAILETTRRLRDLMAIEQALAGSSTGGILGGSMSYGRFYNVIGGDPGQASDLDFLIVCPDLSQGEVAVSALVEVGGTDSDGISIARDRYAAYMESVQKLSVPRESVFSHKLPVWRINQDPMLEHIATPGEYHLSVHITTPEVLSKIILASAPSLDPELLGSSASVADFRETPPARHDHQRNFAGHDIDLEVSCEDRDGSYLRETKVYSISPDGRYYPGMFQNLVLPAFDIQWGGRELRRSIDAFRWKLVERLRLERHERPDELLRLSFSHTRSHVFAPHTVAAIDRNAGLA